MKKFTAYLIGFCLVVVLAACGGAKVDEKTSDKYITKAENVVELLNKQKYEDVTSMFDSTMKENLPVDKLKELEPMLQESGEFEKIKKSSIEKKDDNYIVVLVANYNKDQRVFTISFNKDEEVVGLFIK